MAERERIWELDALRGIAIVAMVIFHAIFDINEFLEKDITLPDFFQALFEYGNLIFIVLSGVSVTLGTKSVKRGLVVFGCGMCITLATYTMIKTGLLESELFIQFGILHLLGLSMLLYPLYKKLPLWLTGITALGVITAGLFFETITVSSPYFFSLGLCTEKFSSGDFYPVFPYMGWFMVGTILGKTIYRSKKSLFGKFKAMPFFCFCGRHSLLIYLAHQPLLYGIISLLPLKG